MAFCFSLALSNIWYEGNERLSTSYHYACQTTWLLCSSVLPFNFALQHMFAHFTNPNPVLVLFISNCCFDACINGFFFSFLSKKTTYNESNMIKNGTTVLDNYCEDILNQSWLKRRKKNSFFRLIHMLNIKCCEFQPIIYLSFVEADVIPFVEFYRFIFGHSVRWVANVIDEKFLAKLATIRTFCLSASLSVFSSS